jgi:5-methylcytosine-specific restriction endonuclease McrA
MPYADPQRQREYQNAWMARRRQNWLDENGPCQRCGATENLEVDHIERHTKVDHKVWSWSQARREAELAKCQVLCESCHLEKTLAEIPGRVCGTNSAYVDRNGKGCRCPECTAAHAQAAREYRARKNMRKS